MIKDYNFKILFLREKIELKFSYKVLKFVKTLKLLIFCTVFDHFFLNDFSIFWVIYLLSYLIEFDMIDN